MIFFVDESGHPHPNDPVACPVLGGVVIPTTETRRLMSALHNLRRDLLGLEGIPDDDRRLKAAAILNPATHRRHSAKWRYLERVVETAANLPVVSFFIVMERPAVEQVMDEYHLPSYLRFLLQRANLYVSQNHPAQKAPIVFDSRSPRADARWSNAIAGFLYKHHEGRTWTNLLETPLFVSSALTPGVQIADYFVGIVRQYWEITGRHRPVTPAYEAAVKRLYGTVKRTVRDLTLPVQGDAEPQTLYGEYRMPSHYWSTP